MKKVSLVIITILFIASCNKSNGVDPMQSEHYPQTWILTVDKDADEYTFIKTNGAVMYRDDFPRSYSLVQLAEDEECEWEVNQSRSEFGDKICYSIRLKKNKKIWLGAAPSSNKQEMHMVASNFTGEDIDDDNYKFFIHKFPDVNGVKTVALESVYFSGYYISDAPPGSQYAQNLVTLQQVSDPSKATKWQCRHN